MPIKDLRLVQRNNIANSIRRESQMILSRVYSIILNANHMTVTPARMLAVILFSLHSIISAAISRHKFYHNQNRKKKICSM